MTRRIRHPVFYAAVFAAYLIASAPLPAEPDTPEEAPRAERAPAGIAGAREDYVAALMARMTLAEKIGQLNLLSSGWDRTGPVMRENYREDIRSGKVGGVFNAYTAAFTRTLQEIAVDETRLGIPLLFGYDVIHGHKTIFPISLGEAASWDIPAIEHAARVAAVEASASGIHWTFAPMVDIARDPRWGRISEGAGEDPWLGSLIAAARVRGFQGDDLSAVDTILATAKHYAAYGQAQAGRDYHTTDMSERVLWDVYLPPFHAAARAGVATFMTAFNELNGVPATANDYLVDDILKTRWHFPGFVVSDYTSVNELVPHGFARDEKDAARLAINAGLDMDMQGASFVTWLPDLVREGKVSERTIDDAVRRILSMKQRLGLFDDPYRYSDEQREKTMLYHPDHVDAARDMARKSLVLLKNDEDVLPLEEGTALAVVGPLADSDEDMIGSWSAAGDRWDRPVTLLEALRERLGDDAPLYHAEGASYRFDADDESGFAAAIAAAKRADVIIAVMGEAADMTGEAASRTSLGLPGTQRALLERLREVGKPIVLVLMNGRPLALGWEDANVDAILETWFSGTEGGHAIADVLFGDYAPAGRLPVTFPRNVGQVPIYYDMKNTGRPYDADAKEQKYRSRYLDTPNTPLYPFGYGLSYTRFEYSDTVVDSPRLEPSGSITVSVRVTNAGKRDGEEVVQLYVRDLVGSVTRPVRELKGFRKVRLHAGESRDVRFRLTPADLAFHRRDMTFGAEAGDFEAYTGPNSDELTAVPFRLTENVTVSD